MPAAARVTDPAGHPGNIAPPGVPTVLIAGMPAATPASRAARSTSSSLCSRSVNSSSRDTQSGSVTFATVRARPMALSLRR